jgi:hypothetical protein
VALGFLAVVAASVPGEAHAQVFGSCAPGPVARIFLPWGDPAWYESVPDGGLEAGGTGWTLRGGAAVVAGNEPYYVRSQTDTRALSLPPGASASTPDTCVGPGHPTLRFFLRNPGETRAPLRVSVQFTDPAGTERSVPIGWVMGARAWTPSPVLLTAMNSLGLLKAQTVSFRFTSTEAQYTVDDVYVDPYGKG